MVLLSASSNLWRNRTTLFVFFFSLVTTLSRSGSHWIALTWCTRIHIWGNLDTYRQVFWKVCPENNTKNKCIYIYAYVFVENVKHSTDTNLSYGSNWGPSNYKVAALPTMMRVGEANDLLAAGCGYASVLVLLDLRKGVLWGKCSSPWTAHHQIVAYERYIPLWQILQALKEQDSIMQSIIFSWLKTYWICS